MRAVHRYRARTSPQGRHSPSLNDSSSLSCLEGNIWAKIGKSCGYSRVSGAAFRAAKLPPRRDIRKHSPCNREMRRLGWVPEKGLILRCAEQAHERVLVLLVPAGANNIFRLGRRSCGGGYGMGNIAGSCRIRELSRFPYLTAAHWTKWASRVESPNACHDAQSRANRNFDVIVPAQNHAAVRS